MTRKRVSAIIVAGGRGVRMGGPKQLLPLGGKPLVRWSLDAFLGVPEVGEVVVVLAPEERAALGELPSKVRWAEPGPTRLGSVRNGFKGVSGELVAVHDGARPLVSAPLIRRCLEEAERHGASVAAAPAVDTLKEGEDGWVVSTPERSRYWYAQTPQCYRRELLAQALETFSDVETATDESQLVERLGKRVRLVESSSENLKVTTPGDLVAAEALLGQRPGAVSVVSRTGFGFDLHRLVPGRKLMLGGVEIPHSKGLLGHSDGDVLLHAVSDAILGALALGEIGQLFPPGEKKIEGIASRTILEKALAMMRGKGASLVHADATLIAEEPKLLPHYPALKASLGALLGLPPDRVSVKAKSHEGLGEIGRGEAIACHAVVTLLAP